jgi:upstream activation factor subunit UAF30
LRIAQREKGSTDLDQFVKSVANTLHAGGDRMAKTAKTAKTAKDQKSKGAKPGPSGKSAKQPRKANAAFMKPVQPSEELAKIVGSKPLARTELTKKLWAYIKKNGLQDPKNKRMIKADADLKRVFGGRGQVDMFEMTKLVNKHVL